MIRRLTILLLIVGCDHAPTEHSHEVVGVCVIKDSGSPTQRQCYNYNQQQCVVMGLQDEISWSVFLIDITCEEYCEAMDSQQEELECVIHE